VPDADATEAGGVSLHPLVREVVDTYLPLVDAEAPGLVQRPYLTGSIALADFRPRASDIDFVAVTSTACTPGHIAALRRAHARLVARHRRPFFDGLYVTWDHLARDPLQAPPGPSAHDNRFLPAIRGPRRQELAIWTSREALAAWTRDNLDRYWRLWQRRSSRLLSRSGLVCLGSWGPAWGVLGVSRLHYTLATGEITSKEGAGLYTLNTFPARWHRIVDECLRIRRGAHVRSLYGDPLTRRREALAFMAMAIDDTRIIP
jgi:hypothetical protein